MKSKFLKLQIKLLIFMVLLILVIPSSAFAHILATDRNIGAVLHINPNDEPVTNEPATFIFELKDKTKKFKSDNCTCQLTITNSGKSIYSQPLFQDSTSKLNTATLLYTFLNPAVYQVIITGKPVDGKSFQSFTLSWDIRVAGPTTNQNTQSTNPFFSPRNILFTTILFGCIIFGGITVIKKARKKND